MECVRHPQEPATAICAHCDRPICARCAGQHQGRTICPECLAKQPNDELSADLPDDLYPEDLFAEGAPRHGTDEDAPLAPATDEIEPELRIALDDTAVDPNDLYQGPEPEELYPQPSAADTYVAMKAPAPINVVEEEGSIVRAILFGLLAVGLPMLAWYGAAFLTGKDFSAIVILMGWLVGIAVVAGAGRGGPDVSFIAFLLVVGAFFGGEYLIAHRGYDTWLDLEPAATGIELDADYTDAETGRLLGKDVLEWGRLTLPDQRKERRKLEERHTEMREEAATRFGLPPDIPLPHTLPFGHFLAQLSSYLGPFPWLFAAIGAFLALMIPSRTD